MCSSMLSSALIGCFTVRLNVELCSDWLFHSAAQCWALLWLAVSQCGSMLNSALVGCFTVLLISVAHRKETQGKYILKYFLTLISFGNYTVNKMLTLIFLGTETAFKCTIAFYFHFRDSLSHVLCLYYGPAILTTDFTRSYACQWCSGSVNHAPSSSVIWT